MPNDTSLIPIEPSRGELAPQAARLDDERAAADRWRVSALSESTKRAYNFAWRDWTAWCTERGVCPCPPAAEDVCAYLTAAAEEGLSLSSVALRYKAIGYVLHQEGAPEWLPPHGSPPVVQMQMSGIARILGRAQKGKDPLRLDDVRAMVQKTGGLTTRGLRDRALLLTHFWGAFRRSEVVALNFGDVKWYEKGVVLHLSRSKTDQEGIGRDVSILFQPDKSICACVALRRWLARAHVKGEEEPVFRPIDHRDAIGQGRLTAGSVAETIKKYAEAVGLDPARFAGHSMRSGFVTEAAVQGVAVSKIMTQTGHKSFEMVQRYVRHADPFEGNATEGMGKVPKK